MEVVLTAQEAQALFGALFLVGVTSMLMIASWLMLLVRTR